MRAGKLWSQVEAIYKQMDTAETELKCFQALQTQEHLAASNRINTLWEEVQKQKELERTLQKRYGDLQSQREKIQSLLEEHRAKAQAPEEIVVKNSVLELGKDVDSAMVNETMDVDVVPEVAPPSTGDTSDDPEMVDGQLGEAEGDSSSRAFVEEGHGDVADGNSQEGVNGPVQGTAEVGDASIAV